MYVYYNIIQFVMRENFYLSHHSKAEKENTWYGHTYLFGLANRECFAYCTKINCSKIRHLTSDFGLVGQDYRVASLSTLYFTCHTEFQINKTFLTCSNQR